MKRLWVWSMVILLLVIPAAAQEMGNTTNAKAETQLGLSAEEIAALPEVELVRPEPDRHLIHDRRYMRVLGDNYIYHSPGGYVARSMPNGFNFVTALSDADGWTRINANEWIPTSYLKDVNSIVSDFTGVFLPEEALPYTLAWALVDIYASPEPGIEGKEEGEPEDQIKRYDMLKIYATEVRSGFDWFQIGHNQWIHQHHVARILPLTSIPEAVNTDLWFGIDLYEQVLTMYRGEKPVFATLVSTGLPRWPTYEGTFNIFLRAEREDMTWGKVGDDYYFIEEVPWTMFFDGGRALHGAYWHDGFGYRRSHGCVNINITDAKWFYDQVALFMGADAALDDLGPAVHVYSTGTY